MIFILKEIREKISKNRISKGISKGERNPMYNKKHTLKTIQKISKSRSGKAVGNKNGMFGKKREDLTQWNIKNNIRYPIGQYDKNMKMLATYPHAVIAATKIGAKTHKNINHLAKNYKKYPNRTAYGFKWRYLLS